MLSENPMKDNVRNLKICKFLFLVAAILDLCYLDYSDHIGIYSATVNRYYLLILITFTAIKCLKITYL